MKPWEVLGSAITPDGSSMQLMRHDGHYVIHVDGYDLMTSYSHGSEDVMMSLACPKPRPGARILIGGLGMGYTLAATLELLPIDGSVLVSEILPEVVEWNRGPLGPLAGYPLDDPRTDLAVGDVSDILRSGKTCFDAILLDVDNGVDSFMLARNSWIYTPDGLRTIQRSLRPGGALAIWSVNSGKELERRLRSAGFIASVHSVRGRGNRGGHYSIFVGRMSKERSK